MLAPVDALQQHDVHEADERGETVAHGGRAALPGVTREPNCDALTLKPGVSRSVAHAPDGAPVYDVVLRERHDRDEDAGREQERR